MPSSIWISTANSFRSAWIFAPFSPISASRASWRSAGISAIVCCSSHASTAFFIAATFSSLPLISSTPFSSSAFVSCALRIALMLLPFGPTNSASRHSGISTRSAHTVASFALIASTVSSRRASSTTTFIDPFALSTEIRQPNSCSSACTTAAFWFSSMSICAPFTAISTVRVASSARSASTFATACATASFSPFTAKVPFDTWRRTLN